MIDKNTPVHLGPEAPALLPYQQRVVDELHDLDERTAKLEAFLTTPAFKSVRPSEQDNLREQLGLHWALQRVLRRRVAGFGVQ